MYFASWCWSGLMFSGQSYDMENKGENNYKWTDIFGCWTPGMPYWKTFKYKRMYQEQDTIFRISEHSISNNPLLKKRK